MKPVRLILLSLLSLLLTGACACRQTAATLDEVDYYAKHGTADEKMKAYYYLGRIHANRGNNNGSILAYTLAEDASKESKDESFKGVLDMSLSRFGML